MSSKVVTGKGMHMLVDAAVNAVYELVIRLPGTLPRDHEKVVIQEGHFLVVLVGNSAAVVKDPNCPKMIDLRQRNRIGGFLTVPADLIAAHNKQAFNFMMAGAA